MTWRPYEPFERPPPLPAPSAPRFQPAYLLMALGLLAVLLGGMQLWRERSYSTSVAPVQGALTAVYSAPLLVSIAQPEGQSWLLPEAALPLKGALYVLDTGHNRILKLGEDGRTLAVFDRLDLQQPMALATDGEDIYVANSLKSEVLVFSSEGAVLRSIPLAVAALGGVTPRPIGLAVARDGSLVVSDADNHRVLFLDRAGNLVRSAGTGARASGDQGFNVPAAIALDAAGNVYVVDVLNWRVVELSPDGVYVRAFGHAGNTGGSLSRPKGVAVDGAGRVFVSDGLMATVEAFAPDGSYLGILGRQPDGKGSLFTAPAALSISGETLYVADRYRGVLSFRLSPP